MVNSQLQSQSFPAIALLLAIGIQAALGQQPASSAPAGVPSAGANSGSYYIEDEILAYKSLQVNSQSIADSVKTQFPGNTGVTGVVVVPSASTILPAFQLWRSNMLISKTYIQQTENILRSAYKFGPDGQVVLGPDKTPSQTGPCPAKTIQPIPGAASFASYASGITTGVGVIQSILSLFTSNQSAAGFQGTVQDQALMTAVSRELRANGSGLKVLVPDVYTPWNIDVVDGGSDPKFFIGQLNQLVTGLSYLQDYYVCNQLAATAGQQLAQDEQNLDSDLTKLATTTVKDADLASIRSDIDNQESQLGTLRTKIGLNITTPPISNWKSALDSAMTALPTPLPTDAPPLKSAALQGILAQEALVIEQENPKVIAATSASSKAQSVLSGINGYLSALTGGAVTISTAAPTITSQQTAAPTSPTTTAQPAQGAAPASPGGAQTPGASPQGTATQQAAPQSSSAPPIVTILQADGLARQMNVESEPTPPPKGTTDQAPDWSSQGWNHWEVLWVKSLDSGSTTDMRSSIWGSSVRFAGGAVSGYALFKMDGTLVCSGNTAAYGGEITTKEFTDPAKLKVLQMIPLNIAGSDCSARAPDLAAGH